MTGEERRRESLGRIAYEAYCYSSGHRSLVSGDRLPAWDDLDDDIRRAWRCAASRIYDIARS